MKKTLYFFTSSYPYGNTETFIETEIKYLSIFFDRIIIFPLFSYDSKEYRAVPENCIVNKPIIKSRFQHYFYGLFGLRSIPLYFKDFFLNSVYKSRNKFKNFIVDFTTTNCISHSIILRRCLDNSKDNDYFYFYWGKGCSNMLPFISKTKSKKIVRFHGFDLYDENSNGYIPIQKYIIKNIDYLVFISKQGMDYFNKKHSYVDPNKLYLSYLGTIDKGISIKSKDGVFRILSCSYVTPIKRVDLIYRAINNIDSLNIEWTHIGDGPEFEKLINLVRNAKSNLKINLIGRKSNEEVLNYYCTKNIDVFINVSTSEGLPVSIMEAISFNVPVIATNVGGTSEIVNSQTGILLNENPSIDDIVNAIQIIIKSDINPRLFWQDNFSAEKNYYRFINDFFIY